MKEKLTAYLAGGTVAIAMTTLLYSMSSDLRSGFDFHAADILLPVLLISAIQLGTFKRPHILSFLLSGVLILSTLWSSQPLLTLYSSSKLTFILLTFSGIRSTLSTHKKQFFIPIIVLATLSIPFAVGLQLILHNNTLAWGFSGNPNITGGHAVILLLNTSLWFTPFWAILLATTGSRSAILGLAVAIPFLALKFSLPRYALIGTAVVAFTLIFSTYYRLVPFEFAPGYGEELSKDGRIGMARDAIERISWLGSGYDTTTQWEATNPHNIYLQFLQELGIPIGLLTITLLLTHISQLHLASTSTPYSITFKTYRPHLSLTRKPYLTLLSSFTSTPQLSFTRNPTLLSPLRAARSLLPLIPHFTPIRNPTLIAILTISFFDHYWLTTGQGMYLLAWALGQAQVQKSPALVAIEKPRNARELEVEKEKEHATEPISQRSRRTVTDDRTRRRATGNPVAD